MSAEPRKAIALSQSEQTALVLCEAKIEEGKAAFLEVGNALARIKAEKLYRGTHGTFEAYCQERWSFSRQYAHSICKAAEVVANLEMSTIVDKLPETESQARPLIKLPKSEQPKAWTEAVERSPTGRPTAKQVEKIVQERLGSTNKPHDFTCPNCGGHELSEHDDCERCKEPIDVPVKRAAPTFDFDRAFFKTSDLLAKIDDLWPESEKKAMCQQVSNWVNQIRRSL